MKRHIQALIIILSIGITANAQDRREYKTDIFGNKIYRINDFEETIGKDIMGNYQYKNNRGEKASLEKDIFGNMTYSDSKGNKVKYDKTIWEDILSKSHNDEERIFLHLIEKYKLVQNTEIGHEKDILGHEVYTENGFKEEYWQDIMGDWQYKNNDGQTASLRIDIMGDLNYKDSEGNRITISKESFQSHRKYRHRNPEDIFRHFVKSILLDW